MSPVKFDTGQHSTYPHTYLDPSEGCEETMRSGCEDGNQAVPPPSQAQHTRCCSKELSEVAPVHIIACGRSGWEQGGREGGGAGREGRREGKEGRQRLSSAPVPHMEGCGRSFGSEPGEKRARTGRPYRTLGPSALDSLARKLVISSAVGFTRPQHAIAGFECDKVSSLLGDVRQ